MIAVFSDIHSNASALESVLIEADRLGCDRFISLGDVVGYHLEPGRCIDLLRERDTINVMGNHDYYLVSGQPCPRSKLVSMLSEMQRSRVDASQLAWLERSVQYLQRELDIFVHGGWRDTQDEYLYRVSEASFPPGSRRFFSGHTHVQIQLKFGERQYVNPGSVGQPRDGDSRAAFATIEGNSVMLHRVAYDIERTVHLMKSAELPSKCYENLYVGAQIGGRVDSVVPV